MSDRATELSRLERRLKRLTYKLEMLEVQRDTETRVEERMRLDGVIETTEADRRHVEDQIAQLQSRSEMAATPAAQRGESDAVTGHDTSGAQAPPQSVSLFYSYSHRDEDLRDELDKHLALLKRQGVIDAWHDRRIGAGDDWAGQIDEHLESADLILLLISPDFMASDYCFDQELTRALARHEAGEARVIPISLRPVDITGAPFAHIQGPPKNFKPVTTWDDRDEAFKDIATAIRHAVHL